MTEALYAWDSVSAVDIESATRRVLNASSGSSGPKPKPPAGGVNSIVVRLDEDIDEDDTDPHPAEVMELTGGEWHGTKTFVRVRSTGNESLDKDRRYIAVPIGNGGLVVGGGV
jgi:hypothetical protein